MVEFNQNHLKNKILEAGSFAPKILEAGSFAPKQK